MARPADPAAHEARLRLYEQRAEAGVDVLTGLAPTARRTLASLAAELRPDDEELRDQAAWTDQREEDAERRAEWLEVG